MDSFMNIAKEGFQAYQRSQSGDIQKTGGEEYNSPSNNQQQSSGSPNIDDDTAVRHANDSSNSGNSSLFSSALGFIKSNSGAHHDPVNENHVQNAHDQAYSQGNASNLSAESMGSAAALQALKSFTSGGGASGGGDMQSKLIGMAMSEASNLFDSSGGAASGNKQDVINSAGMTVMKLLVQSKFSGMIGGGDSGGLGGIMSLANKFM